MKVLLFLAALFTVAEGRTRYLNGNGGDILSSFSGIKFSVYEDVHEVGGTFTAEPGCNNFGVELLQPNWGSNYCYSHSCYMRWSGSTWASVVQFVPASSSTCRITVTNAYVTYNTSSAAFGAVWIVLITGSYVCCIICALLIRRRRGGNSIIVSQQQSTVAAPLMAQPMMQPAPMYAQPVVGQPVGYPAPGCQPAYGAPAPAYGAPAPAYGAPAPAYGAPAPVEACPAPAPVPSPAYPAPVAEPGYPPPANAAKDAAPSEMSPVA